MPFDQVSDSIKQFLLKNKQQIAVRTYTFMIWGSATQDPHR